MFARVLEELDAWILRENEDRRADDLQPYKPCTIRLVGQTALLESGLGVPLVATQDVDVYADYEHSVRKKFEELLAHKNLVLDPVGHEAWMPKETEYELAYQGAYATGQVAHPDFVLVSKALKAPNKNRVLLTDYLAMGATDRFLTLAKKYKVNLEQFL